MTESTPVLGIFVGGGSIRMGSPKGLLKVPGGDETILDALVARGRASGFRPVLVGDAAPYEDQAKDVERLADEPPGAGPLGGLNALLAFARGAPCVAVACDMPFVTAETLARLRDWPVSSPVLAARRAADAPWEPMLARYDSRLLRTNVADAVDDGVRSFQKLFARLDVEEWPLDDEIARALQDWDTPDDLLSSRE